MSQSSTPRADIVQVAMHEHVRLRILALLHAHTNLTMGLIPDTDQWIVVPTDEAFEGGATDPS